MLGADSQLTLPLGTEPPHSPHYFVPHSGIAQALETLRVALEAEGFSFFRLEGPRGCGKTHLLELLRAEAAEKGFTRLAIFDEPLDWSLDENVRLFIDGYESFKSDGGAIFFAAAVPENPHVSSRCAMATIVELNFPPDDELRPLVGAILERRGLRLPEDQLDYLLERLPASPLSLSAIFAKIDRLSLALGKRPNRALFRAVLSEAWSAVSEEPSGDRVEKRNKE